jgi:hypothetical protein
MTIWRRDQIRFVLDDDTTSHPIVNLVVETPSGRLVVMDEPFQMGRTMMLGGLHMHGEDVGANQVGVANLQTIVQALLEVMDLDELLVTGGVRTTGASPGSAPRTIRFTRRTAAGMGR